MSRKHKWRSKVRASRCISGEDLARVILLCILYGDMPLRKKMEIASSNNWKKFHGYPMKRGWREIKC